MKTFSIPYVYYLQSNNQLEKHNFKSVRCGTTTISSLGPKISNLYQENIKKYAHYLLSKEKFQIQKQMNVLTDYVKHIYNIWVLLKCAFTFP